MKFVALSTCATPARVLVLRGVTNRQRYYCQYARTVTIIPFFSFPILCPTAFTKSYMMLSIFCTQAFTWYSGRVSRQIWLLKLLASLELRRRLLGEIVPQTWRRRRRQLPMDLQIAA